MFTDEDIARMIKEVEAEREREPWVHRKNWLLHLIESLGIVRRDLRACTELDQERPTQNGN